MAGARLRIVVVGASSLLGKELSEELPDSVLGTGEIVLCDTEAAEGQVTAIGNEPALIQRLSNSSFAGADFVFFAGAAEQTRSFWKTARQAGATVVDLSAALVEEPEALTWSPWLQESETTETAAAAKKKPDLRTSVIVAAHPVAVLLTLIANRLGSRLHAPRTLAATILQPASELGSPGMDELHQQTVSLLSFKELPQEVFDTQVAFNIVGAFGPESTAAKLSETERMMRREVEALRGEAMPALSLHLLQAPVFHGYTVSVFLEFPEPVTLTALRQALEGSRFVLSKEDLDPPSNLATAGQREFLLAASSATQEEQSRTFWLYVAADNLKLAAANGIDCALSMRSLRPQGKVQ